MSNQLALQKSINNQVTGYFANEVSKFVRTMPGIISDSESRRLTMALVIKASATLEEQKIEWKNIDIKKFVNDAVRIVVMGLDAGNNEAYAIPYKNQKTGKHDLQCIPSAKGLQKLVELYSIKPIMSFRSFIIKEGDTFKLKRTPAGDVWEYEEDVFGTGKPRGYVTIVHYEDGICNVMTHSKEDIEKRRTASKSPNSPAWSKWYDEMAIAKATRRHCTRIPIRMPDQVKEAFDAMDDDETEQITKDATPPTIALESGPVPAGHEDDQDLSEPVSEPESQPDPEPLPLPPPPPAEPPKMIKQTAKPLPKQLPLETAVSESELAPDYDPEDTSWMEA